MNNFSNKLITWYKENKRDLPWRATADPYKIWISEIILQQTRVAQGYDYYMRFIKRFPDVKTLAEAPEDEVLNYWQGLGYYSRARNLHAAAKSIQGDFPVTYEEVRALKGVGDYTAAAICSIAYNLPHAVVDGNVYRVLSRYLGIDTPIDSTEGKKLFAAIAQEMMDTQYPATYNQAIMDFGALQCTPVSPKCLFCPLSDSCVALTKGWVNRLPIKEKKTKVRERYFNYFFVRSGNTLFLHKRNKKDVWENLYELPLVETDKVVEEKELIHLSAFRNFFVKEEEVQIRLVKSNVKHVLSHQIILTNFYEIILSPGSTAFNSFIKVNIEDIDNYPVSKLVHSFLEEKLNE